MLEARDGKWMMCGSSWPHGLGGDRWRRVCCKGAGEDRLKLMMMRSARGWRGSARGWML